MKAIGFSTPGGPEVLTRLELPDPHPGPVEVRIRVAAAAVNPTDTTLRSGRRPLDAVAPPYVPGMDAAGVVDEVGDGSRWQVGDEVMAIALPLGEHRGAYAEYLIAPDDSLTRMPAGSSIEEAATLPMNGLTATQVLERLALRPGQTLAVLGAAGALGGYAVQLAKHAGLVVIADAAEKDRDLVAGFGADHVVARGDDVADRIRDVVPDGVDAVLDAALLHERAAAAVRDGGAMAVVRGWDGDPGRGITVHKIAVAAEYHSGGKLDELRRLAEDRTLTLRVADILPAEQAAEAHRRLEAGGVRGRMVLRF
ncbi:MAG TPA: NADP-dependent oxidoreductase [Naasia sp.]